MRPLRHLLIVLLIAGAIRSASAFGLLGPFAPWMLQPPLSYQYFSDTGAPMAFGEGYRWNVPVVTYGYDQTFLDYFGTNGVAAVESAIQVLNSLPPASAIVLSNYNLGTQRINFSAANENLYDLKSSVLSYLLEQMGLAPPSSSLFCLTNFSYDFIQNLANYGLDNRNFDPVSLQPTLVVNSVDYWYTLYFSDFVNYIIIPDDSSNGFVRSGSFSIIPPLHAFPLLYASDPELFYRYPPVANNIPAPYTASALGLYYAFGLTLDDVGGICYLLNTNNVAMEGLIPGVQGSGTNASNFVNKALRPGADKITFQRIDYTSSNQPVFPIVTNQYVDSYFTNGILQQQMLQRVITQPDILFKANYDGISSVAGIETATAFRTGASNWINNGAPLHDGPGVIQGPIVINLNRFGPNITFSSQTYPPPADYGTPFTVNWGSFDGTTNAPVVYPVPPTATNFTVFRFYLQVIKAGPQSPSFYTWNLRGQPNALFTLQTSTNLTDWVPITTITNLGGTFSYFDIAWTNTPTRFFRTVPQ